MSSLGRQQETINSPVSLAAQSHQRLATLAADIDANAFKKKTAASKYEATPSSITVGFTDPTQEGSKKNDGASSSQAHGKTPNKTMTKAERRAIQEAQRAAKAAKQGEGAAVKGSKAPATSNKLSVPQITTQTVGEGASASSDGLATPEGGKQTAGKNRNINPQPNCSDRYSRLGLFSHLPTNSERSSVNLLQVANNAKLHPSVVRLGLAYNRGNIVGSNARCRAMMEVFKELISDYKAPLDKDFGRELEQRLRPHISFLSECRPMASSMRNAVRFLKMLVVSKTPQMNDVEAKAEILEDINIFIRVRIDLADDEIAALALKKIVDGDVILTYAYSHVVCKALIGAHEAGKKFKVIIVDARPRLEGRQMLQRLSQAGLQCSYVMIQAAAYALKEATKVLLGAATFFTNGHLLSRVGTSVVTMMAYSQGVPVIVCCETYKFWDRRVQTDSFVYNEVDDPDKLVATIQDESGSSSTPLLDWQKTPQLHPLSIMYDVTPPNFIDMVITEVGLIPCTSVPVILREYDITKNLV